MIKVNIIIGMIIIFLGLITIIKQRYSFASVMLSLILMHMGNLTG